MASIIGQNGNDTLTGTGDADQILGGGGNDVIYGLDKDDYIQGDGGNDTIYGGDNDDVIFGDSPTINVSEAGLNVIYGGAGNDAIWVGIAGDTMYGEGDDDSFYVRGTSGPSRYDGGSGDNKIFIMDFANYNPDHSQHVTLRVSSMNYIQHIVNLSGKAAYIETIGGSLDLTKTNLVDITLIQGQDDADNIKGNVIYDTATNSYRGAIIQGGNNNDTIAGSRLDDTLAGDNGNDGVSGGDGNDYITGGTGQDTLIGGAGFDRLFGGAGSDLLAGQAGNDELTGGSESDLFYFNLNGGQDIITDFQNGVDRIALGSDITNINLFTFQGHAALQLTAGSSASSTYVLLQGVTAAQIDGSDFLWT
ncbi:calcium-binding protein [Methylobacterium oryzihabitans]|uniref:Calcium-binding protein n=1 Tax=Methylobacterium oryzihabitans TaxID=2499852 RepID=A0A3S2YMB2_9HYPH|nr:calcium-binding protein [Methylobacterium oryzihabitans]RVU14378.1 calcium-binding protein [Methylobacterium oryzihabitans]